MGRKKKEDIIKEKDKNRSGTLYLVGTPIGNLKDITLRAIETLEKVDCILAEDTRQTLKLLNHLNISKRLISYHKFNEKEREDLVISMLNDGNNIALVSDAGMPILSDPGAPLVERLVELNMSIEVIPGPTALTTAIAYSNIPVETFSFEGFLPVNTRKRRERINLLKKDTRTLIFYEAPHKLLNTLENLYKAVGNRKICILRELTKLHEEAIYVTITDMITRIKENGIKGEIVLILEGNKEVVNEDESGHMTNIELVKKYIKEGMDKNTAIKQVAKLRGVSKNTVYMECVSDNEK